MPDGRFFSYSILIVVARVGLSLTFDFIDGGLGGRGEDESKWLPAFELFLRAGADRGVPLAVTVASCRIRKIVL
jgi:hypothetical protein